MLLLAIFFSACTKIDTTSVGSGLIPGVDNINTFDTTLNVIATNYDNSGECDSVSSGDLQALGIISSNPLFGSSLANMYVELKPSSYPFTLPAHDTLSMVVDSVVLILKYDHSYGDTNVLQHVNVYELSDKMKLDSAYRTCDYFNHKPDLLGQASYIPARLKDSIHAFREDDAKQLRIPINNSWGTAFLNAIPGISTDSAFKEYFKGFAITSDESVGGQSLNYFNLNATQTRLAIYVRSKKDTVKDTSIINLTFNLNSAQANYIHRDRGTSEITQHLAQPTGGDSLLFIDATPGSYAKLKIPSLTGFPNCVINRAELIVDQVYDPLASVFSPPDQMYIEIEDPNNAGKYIPIPCDFSMTQMQSGFSYLGGKPKKVADGNGNLISRYSFNISRYVQGIVTKNEANSTLRLSAPFYIQNSTSYNDRCGQSIQNFIFPIINIADGGVKLSGTNQTASRIRLYIVYSKL